MMANQAETCSVIYNTENKGEHYSKLNIDGKNKT
jgi:hypothetical protein